MKSIGFILLLTVFHSTIFSQYYFRGTVTDNHGDKLQYVKITVKSTGVIYRTDVHGLFGFSSKTLYDSVSFAYDGYESQTKLLNANENASVVLNSLPASAIFIRNHLSSLPLDIKDSSSIRSIQNETYNSVNENSFLFTEEIPSISFSANINGASYSNVRRFINSMEGPVPPEAVRIEELLNYFNFHYTDPQDDSVFHVASFLTTCPWNAESQLLYLNISAKKISMQHLPASNLVFLIDVSGSMDMPNKLPLLQSGFRLLVKNLRPIDTISVVTYGETVTVLLDGVSGMEKEKITRAIDGLSADGPTPGEAGIKLAYQLAQKHFIKEGNNRIFLGADGDFNVGLSTEKELETMIEYQKQSGVYLTCLGVGVGNFKDSKLSVLSQIGNGNFAYIDNEHEAEKVLVSELTQTLFTVADNVYITASFNPALTRSYRLIGYDNDRTALTDTSKNIEGGEIGSGHSLMAIFEIYPNTNTNPEKADSNIANVKVNYSIPGQRILKTISYNCSRDITEFKYADSSLKKAACVVLFGMKLKQSDYTAHISWKSIQNLCNKVFYKNNIAEKEFLMLVNKAQKIYRRKRQMK